MFFFNLSTWSVLRTTFGERFCVETSVKTRERCAMRRCDDIHAFHIVIRVQRSRYHAFHLWMYVCLCLCVVGGKRLKNSLSMVPTQLALFMHTSGKSLFVLHLCRLQFIIVQTSSPKHPQSNLQYA